jgi:hypothetical protein
MLLMVMLRDMLTVFFTVFIFGLSVIAVTILLRLFGSDHADEVGLPVLVRILVFAIFAFVLLYFNQFAVTRHDREEELIPSPATIVIVMTLLSGLVSAIVWWLVRCLGVVWRRFTK